jgi:hypothetical protein
MILLNDQWVIEEIKGNKKKILKVNENTTYSKISRRKEILKERNVHFKPEMNKKEARGYLLPL